MTTVSHVSEKIDSDSSEAAGAGLECYREQLFISQHEILHRKIKLGYVAGVLNDPR